MFDNHVLVLQDVFKNLLIGRIDQESAKFYIKVGELSSDELERINYLRSLPIAKPIMQYYEFCNKTITKSEINDFLEELALKHHCTFDEANEIWKLVA